MLLSTDDDDSDEDGKDGDDDGDMMVMEVMSRYPYLVTDHTGKSFSWGKTTEILAVFFFFLIDALYQVKEAPFVHSLLRIFIINKC